MMRNVVRILFTKWGAFWYKSAVDWVNFGKSKKKNKGAKIIIS